MRAHFQQVRQNFSFHGTQSVNNTRATDSCAFIKVQQKRLCSRAGAKHNEFGKKPEVYHEAERAAAPEANSVVARIKRVD